MITAPAVGVDLGIAALFFHAPKDYDPNTQQADELVLGRANVA